MKGGIMPRSLPDHPKLEFLKKQAKKLLQAHKNGDQEICATLRLHHRFEKASDREILKASLSLQETQHALALDYGFKSWKELKQDVMKTEKDMTKKAHFTKTADLLNLDDFAIQLVLRDIDTNDLAAAMLDAGDELRDLIFRNMSKRAVVLLKDMMQELQLADKERRKGEQQMLTITQALVDAGMITPGESTSRPKGPSGSKAKSSELANSLKSKPLSGRDNQAMIAAFKAMAETARAEGLLSLEKIIDSRVDDELSRVGLQLVVDGTDPQLVAEITATKKQALLADYEKRLDIIISAVKAIQRGDAPAIVEERCKAFL